MTDQAIALAGASATTGFEHWWQLPARWVEQPNQRRGGWSGVLKGRWRNRDVYIKRQQSHLYRSWRHPLGRPTVCRELENLQRLHSLGIGCPEVLFCGTKGSSAVLVLQALDQYMPMDQLSLPDSRHRQQLAQALGICLGRLHQHRLQHGCLYPKHIFVRADSDQWEIALLDLEKMRPRLSANASARHDLDQLQRHQSLLDRKDWDLLLQAHQSILQA
ncbi:lipopolysaccharide kinase InaA family protein [Halopseudomonas sp.]|jgi:tRNA A-37 threonylcarbamoyl transferase component Bud32|uniref:lipopolysaccharide kinase InaA family protein n=1 Tax=Halopseudomonas sp. TaxID=2901191 RepID=UPI00300385A3|tara:strand:- start:43 stop:696 length:654 start_codon:yes stop_codon:yes gene_type:complete